jgi:hypothetical protein
LARRRRLDDDFIMALKAGTLKPLLDWVKADSTLGFQIRDNEAAIYYRGGRLLRLTRPDGGYALDFDERYFNGDSVLPLPDRERIKDWLAALPWLKQAMDSWLTKNPRAEREFQQLLVRDNNFSLTGRSSDYFIVDIEYQTRTKARFDAVAFKWPSRASHRRLAGGFKLRLALLELKQGDASLTNASGLIDHCDKLDEW